MGGVSAAYPLDVPLVVQLALLATEQVAAAFKAAAASIKSEVYLYRTRVGGYAPLAYDKSAQLALLSGGAQQRSTGNKSARDGQPTAASGSEASDACDAC